MIKSTFGITLAPFVREKQPLLPQQERILDVIKAHAQHGGLSVILGKPGVGKTVLKEAIIELGKQASTDIISFSRTMDTYTKILKQIATAMLIEPKGARLDKEIIGAAHKVAQERKTLYTLIDEAHLIDMGSLRRLRLLFDQFPKRHNLVLFGQPELMHDLTLKANEDFKSRITFSKRLLPLNDQDLVQFIHSELKRVKLPMETFDEAALELITRSCEGNLRLCCNLSYCSLLEACQQKDRVVSPVHVNTILIQPHWRDHQSLIKDQAD